MKGWFKYEKTSRGKQAVENGESYAGNIGFDCILQRAIEDGLNETLGQSFAWATRICLDTSVALEDPVTYVTVLQTFLGNRAFGVIRHVERKFQTIRALRSAGVTDFCESIMYLKRLYSAETLARWK